MTQIDQKKETAYTRYELRNRYQFTGQLVMQTALHIGGGRATGSSSDSPVVLTPEKQPFIPGSSFKGALRSTVEKLVPSLPIAAGFYSCALIELDQHMSKEERKKLVEPYGREDTCPTVRQGDIVKERRDKNGAEIRAVMDKVQEDLCDTCRLFGSPYAAAHININDLYVVPETWSDVLQTRDGVAIDRDTEKARDRLKYDYEVVPASTAFNLHITLENATEKDLQLLAIGLSEFVHGFGAIGGMRSRGLGGCILEGLEVAYLDLTNAESRSEQLRDYLKEHKLPNTLSGEQFIEKQIDVLFADQKKAE